MEKISSLWRNLVSERHIGPLEKTQKIFESLSITEKTIFLVCAGLFIAGSLSLVAKVSNHLSSEIPSYGGELVEGIVDTPRFINPLLATSDADRDLTALVYSGLLKATPTGEYIPDLAETYSVSPDGLTYTFTLRKDARFHDGKPVTADDIKYTIEKAQDSSLRSPRRVNWEGVSIEKSDTYTIVFSLKQPYAPFISSLTIGVLPRHIWQTIGSDQIPFSSKNIEAIGSGPFKIDEIKKSKDGIPTQVTLVSNKEYTLGKPYISKITFKFFGNESVLVEAFKKGSVKSASNLTPASAQALENNHSLITAPLTRVFGVFFNQSENELLVEKSVREALSVAIDKNSIIENVLLGYGTQTNGPLPEKIISTETASTSPLTRAQNILTKSKWIKNSLTGELERKESTGSTTLSISLSTANVPELVDIASRIETDWKNLGAQVDVQVFEQTDLNQGVIRPRKYEALLFGLVTGKNADLYPFWHSSQRNDPGLNVSLYTNTTADKLLEKMRIATSSDELAKLYTDFKTEIDSDIPAVFLWSPDFIYAVPYNLGGVSLGQITTPSDRFIGVEKWYMETDRVWNAFLKKDDVIINKD